MTTPDDAQAFRVALIYADERIKAAEAERDAAVRERDSALLREAGLIDTAGAMRDERDAAVQAAEQAHAALQKIAVAGTLPGCTAIALSTIARAALAGNS